MNEFQNRNEIWIPATVAAVCTIGALAALVTAGDVMAFVLTARPATELSDPPRTFKLIPLCGILLGVGLSLGIAAWRVLQLRSVHRTVTLQWTFGFTILWSLLSLYLLLLYYPLPYHSHHIEKLLLGSVVMLLWSVAFVLRPIDLAALLNRKAYGWIKVGVINVLVFLLVGEVILRLMDPVLARGGLFGNKDSPADLKPNVLTQGSIRVTNSHGFRDRERVFERTSPAPRILALGDSFTYGAGVAYDDIFTTILERRLQEAAPGLEVINLGVSGWDPSEEFHLLKIYGSRFQPDAVMMNFFIGNDIMRRRGAFFEEPMVVAGQSYYIHTVGNWVHDTFGPDRWYLYHNLNYLLKMGVHRFRLPEDGEIGNGNETGFFKPFRTREAYLKDIDERSEIYLKEDTSSFDYHWNRTLATLNSMRLFLERRGIPLILVLLPAQEQVDRDLQRNLMNALGATPDQYDFEKPQRLLKAWGEQQHIIVVDLLPAFRGQAAPSAFYFENDIHWTKAGHKLAAKTLWPLLKREIATRQLAHDAGILTEDMREPRSER